MKFVILNTDATHYWYKTASCHQEPLSACPPQAGS